MHLLRSIVFVFALLAATLAGELRAQSESPATVDDVLAVVSGQTEVLQAMAVSLAKIEGDTAHIRANMATKSDAATIQNKLAEIRALLTPHGGPAVALCQTCTPTEPASACSIPITAPMFAASWHPACVNSAHQTPADLAPASGVLVDTYGPMGRLRNHVETASGYESDCYGGQCYGGPMGHASPMVSRRSGGLLQRLFGRRADH